MVTRSSECSIHPDGRDRIQAGYARGRGPPRLPSIRPPPNQRALSLLGRAAAAPHKRHTSTWSPAVVIEGEFRWCPLVAIGRLFQDHMARLTRGKVRRGMRPTASWGCRGRDSSGEGVRSRKTPHLSDSPVRPMLKPGGVRAGRTTSIDTSDPSAPTAPCHPSPVDRFSSHLSTTAIGIRHAVRALNW